MNESVLHFGAVKLRVEGSGKLTATIFNMDKSQSFTPNDFDLDVIDGTEPLVLTNLNTQRAILRLETNTKDAVFTISRIVLYQKPIWASLPG
jgi:hypothetical protein